MNVRANIYDDLRRQVERLQAENDELRQALGWVNDHVHDLAAAFNLTPQCARVLAMIAVGRGRRVLRDSIDDYLPHVLPGRRMGRTKNVMVYVARLRDVFGKDGIISHGWGESGAYAISAEALAQIDDALGQR